MTALQLATLGALLGSWMSHVGVDSGQLASLRHWVTQEGPQCRKLWARAAGRGPAASGVVGRATSGSGRPRVTTQDRVSCGSRPQASSSARPCEIARHPHRFLAACRAAVHLHGALPHERAVGHDTQGGDGGGPRWSASAPPSAVVRARSHHPPTRMRIAVLAAHRTPVRCSRYGGLAAGTPPPHRCRPCPSADLPRSADVNRSRARARRRRSGVVGVATPGCDVRRRARRCNLRQPGPDDGPRLSQAALVGRPLRNMRHPGG